MTDETRRDEREHLQQTLPPTGVAMASLRWRAKDLGGLYCTTCVEAGCPYQADSWLGLYRHLREGHYRLDRIRLVSDNSSWQSSRSPSIYYPINPAITKGKGMQLKNCHLCQLCEVYFSTAKAMQRHYLK